jgi:hypothetical protein
MDHLCAGPQERFEDLVHGLVEPGEVEANHRVDHSGASASLATPAAGLPFYQV